jgi:hypothetical protein
MSNEIRFDLAATIKDAITSEQLVSKDADDTTTRTKYSAQGFSIANGTTDKHLDIDDMSSVDDVILTADQDLTVKVNGLTTYGIQSEAQTSTARDRVSTNSIINSVTGVWLASATFTIGTASFVGAGLNDLTTSGTYTGTVSRKYRVTIQTAAIPDTFAWSDNDGQTWTTGVAITGVAQTLSNGVRITFGATTGHNIGDRWNFEVGLVGTNYFTGGSFNIREISLGTNLPSAATNVLIDYTTSSEISFNEKFVLQGSSVKSLYVTNNSGNTANLYVILAGD